MAWLTRHAAAQGIAKARRDGAYELLLTTPLNPSDIVRGVLETVRLHFRALANFLVLLNVLMMLGGLTLRRWNVGALIEYFVIWSFLLTWSWSLGHRMSRVLPVMWASLVRPVRRTRVLLPPRFNSWSWIWIVFNAQFYSRGFRRFPTGSPGEIVFVCFIALVCLIIWGGAAIHHSGGSARVREIPVGSRGASLARKPVYCLRNPVDPRIPRDRARAVAGPERPTFQKVECGGAFSLGLGAHSTATP